MNGNDNRPALKMHYSLDYRISLCKRQNFGGSMATTRNAKEVDCVRCVATLKRMKRI